MPDTTLTSAELDELEALAKAATPGQEWFADMSGLNLVARPPGDCFIGAQTVLALCATGEHVYQVLPYIAAAQPATILRLLSLARAGLEAGKAEESMREPYLVWSNEHHAWWRPNSRGYAKSIEDAGVYSREEAMDIAGTSRNGWTVDHTPDEIPVAVSDIPERMRAAIRALPLTGGDK